MQQSVPNWHDALLKLPDRALLKGFDAGLLKDGKETWAAAGRDPTKLYTLFRHADVQTAPAGDWESAKAHWRRMFARWVDGTFLEVNGQSVDYVSEANEYTATSTWSDPDGGALAIQNAQAAAWVWNHEYRGRNVTSADGGQGFISANCKLCIVAGPVSNWIDRRLFELSLAEDCPIDYHAYCLCKDGARVPEDWREHSGLWHFMEQAHGLYPEWVFGESGPYRSTFEGWRSANVLNSDVGKLAAVMRAWIADVVQTRAYREGRVIGTGAWFTSGRVGGWENYEMDTPELIAVADAIRPLWVAPTPIDTRARVQDVSGLYQDPMFMHYPQWRGLGFALGFYEVAIGLRLIRWAQEHHDAMRAAGYITGPYLALHEADDPRAQAALLVLQRRADDDGPSLLDFERDGLSEAMLAQFCDQYDASSRWPLWIYTRKGFWETKVPAARRARYAKYGLYLAAWPYDTPTGEPVPMDPVSVALRSTPPDVKPLVPAPWLVADAQQHTGQGSLPGYDKFLDLGVYGGTEAQLRARFPRLEPDMPNVTVEDLQAIATAAKAQYDITQKYLAPPVPQPLFRVRVVATSLNIRSTPGVITAATDIGDALKDQVFEVWEVVRPAGYTYDWYRIDPAQQRWIAGGSFVVRV